MTNLEMAATSLGREEFIEEYGIKNARIWDEMNGPEDWMYEDMGPGIIELEL